MAARLEFEWDDVKASSNAAKHGVSFPFATRVFLDPQCAEFDTSRAEDGEARRKAVGLVDGRLFTVVFSQPGGVTRVISARRSNPKEEREYGSFHA